ncbi:MAG: aminodeoxychorismate/anthranilate synthase component I, partial [Planctomycetota bacterium]
MSESTTTPLVQELAATTTPREVFRRVAHLPYCLFLESGMRHEELGRYSFVMADPTRVYRGREIPTALRMTEARAECPNDPGLPPFQGGWAGLLGYELAHQFERLPRGL